MIGDGCYEPLSRENGHKIARWFTPKSKLCSKSHVQNGLSSGCKFKVSGHFRINHRTLAQDHPLSFVAVQLEDIASTKRPPFRKFVIL